MGLRGAEVEDKHQVAAHVGQHLVVVLVPKLAHGQLLEVLDSANEVDHVVVPVVEELVLQVLTVHEIPLAAGILVAPAVPLTGEVNPLGMSPLVAHEVEVGAVDERSGHQANHLVQRHAAVHGAVVVARHHVPVHLLVDEAEDDGLVTHEGLVVALGIGNGLLVGTAVGQLPENGSGVPILVLTLLDGLDPVVGDAHRHAVVKADAAVLESAGQSGHAAHLLGNGDGMGIDGVDQHVGQREIGDGIGVLAAIVIIVIAAECLSQAVAVIEHRGHAIEAEAVKLVLLQPELAVGQQEIQHGILAVIEAQRVPCRVFALAIAVEVQVARAVKAAQALDLVLHRMGVHDVHDNGHAGGMGVIDEVFQLLRSAETRRGCIETRHMVAE